MALYIAMDICGQIYLYEHKPTHNKLYWNSKYSKMRISQEVANALFTIREPIVKYTELYQASNWQDSLIRIER